MTCNRPYDEILRKALNSLAAQTYRRYELVFVCSIPSTIKLVQNFCSHWEINLNLCFFDKAKNRMERFKIGANRALGDFVCCFDSDDVLHPQALEILDKSLDLYPIMNFFTSSHISFFDGEQSGIVNASEPALQTIGNLLFQFRQKHFWGFTRQEDYWPRGWLDSGYAIEDYWCFAQLAMEGRAILHIPHCLYGYRRWSGQYTEENHQELREMCEDIRKRLQLFNKRQGPHWHFGDMALAARMTLARERLMKEIAFR